MTNKIVIFGAGISGCILALAFSKFGIKTLLIEKKSKNDALNPDDLRTTALNDYSQKFLKNIDIWDSVKEFSTEILDIFVCNNESDNILHFQNNSNAMGYMIENKFLRVNFLKLAINDPLIDIRFESEYSELKNNYNSLEFLLNDKDGNSEFVTADVGIIAEGKFSELRKREFTDFFEKDYGQSAIICNVEHSINHENGAIEHFLPRGPFATLPLKGGNISSMVWTEKTDIAKMFLTQPDEIIENFVRRFSGNALGEVKLLFRPKSYSLSAFGLKNYYKKRLVAIADTAHIIHPLAGQGLNLGIKDIACLVEIFTKNFHLGLSITENSLKKYENTRKFDNLAMFHITDKINKIFSKNFFSLNSAINISFSFLNNSSIIKKQLIRYAMGNR